MEIFFKKDFVSCKKKKGLVKEIIKSNSSKKIKMKIKVINSLYFSVDYMRLSGNVNIEKLGSHTPPNFHLVFEMEFQMTVPWKFYMRLPCFQFVQIQTRLSTWKMSFKINMKSSWLWNSKYLHIQILGVKIFFEAHWNSQEIFI